MSSVGQGVGMVVGAVVGFFIPALGVMMGMAIGGAIGSAIDPPKGPKIEGPRLSDTKQQTSTYGAFITRTYGNIDAAGNVFWIENNSLKETSKTEEQGGKGGGGSEVTTYSYSGTFAVGLCECDIGEVKKLGRIWLRGKLWYDPVSTVDDVPPSGVISSVVAATLEAATMASGDASQYFTFYNGSSTQSPDTRMQAALGVGSVPAYRGLCYIVFKDLPLEEYGNSIVFTQVKVEIISQSSQTTPVLLSTESSDNNSTRWELCVISIGADDVDARASHSNETWDLRTKTYRMDHYPSGSFLSSEITNSNVWLNTSNTKPGKYPWILYPLYQIGDSSGYSYNNVKYPTATTVSWLHTWDWTIDEDGNLFYLYAGNILYKTVPAGPRAQIYLAGAKIFHLLGDLLYVIATGTTYCLDKDLNLLFTYANSLQTEWGSGGGYSWMTFSADDGHIWLQEVYGVGHRTVARLNANASAIEDQYAVPEMNSQIRGSCFVKKGICIRAYVDTVNWRFTVERWNLRTLQLQSVSLSEIVSRECLRSGLLTAGDIDVTKLTQSVRGYKISNTGSIRSALESLRACWPFDVVPSGYKIDFIPRGGASTASIPYTELGAREGSTDGKVMITQSREMATQLPRRVEVTYVDYDREYDIGPAGISERHNVDSVAVQKVELPIVLNASEAQGKAEVLLYLWWLERHDLSFSLPPSRLNLQVADIITINAVNGIHVCRITEMAVSPDGRLDIKAKLASTSVYTPPAAGQVGESTGQALTYAGPSNAVLMDIPCVVDDMNTAGFSAAMYGSYDGWSGGVLVRTDDGQTWSTLLGFSPPSSTVGYAASALPAGRLDIIDTANLLEVAFQSGDPSSVTELAMYAGANMFAYGADQRWEIISAKTVVDGVSGRKVLSNLLRGRFGTDWAMSLHQANDAVVMLDLNTTQFASQNLSSLGISRNYRAISQGKGIDSAANIPFSYRGVNLECLSPVYLNGSRDPATSDWTLTWQRRGRVDVAWRDYADVPLGETTEAYDLEIWDSSAYNTLKRTISVTASSAAYTKAQQATDFGGDNGSLYVRLFQKSESLSRGYPLQANIVRSIAPIVDPYFAYVSALLHLNGTQDSLVFTDVKGNTWNRGNPVKIDTAQSLFGGASGYFPPGGYLYVADSAAFEPAGDPFTVEFAIRFIAAGPGGSGDPLYFVHKDGGVSGQFSFALAFYYQGGGFTSCCIYYSANGTDQTLKVGTVNVISLLTVGAWVKVTVTRTGSTFRFFINGTLVDTLTLSVTFFNSTAPFKFGMIGGGGCYGNIDEFRFTKECRYTASYTPINLPFPDS